MRNIRLVLPRPHVRQQEVIDAAKRFNVVDCGRRWGKTELGMDRITHPAIAGKPCGWFAPSYKQLAPVWRDMQERLRVVTAGKSEQEHRLSLIGGGAVEMWSLDSPDAGRGRAYARVIIDEAAMVQDLKIAWEQSIRPMLTDYRGDAWFLSTPKGIANYFHEIYQRGVDLANEDWASWQMPSSTNPFIPAGEIDSARGDMTDLAFAQEYLAQFVSWEGSVFRCIDQAVYVPPDAARAAVLIGVDWGRTHDFTVFVAVDPHGRVLALDRFRGMGYALQRERLREFWMRVSGGRAIILAESNSMGGPVIEQLQRDKLLTCPKKEQVMTKRTRKNFSSDFKAKVALEAIQGVKTLNEIGQEYGVHPVQVGKWKKELQEQASTLFDAKRGTKPVEPTADPEKLYTEIGRLKVELDWLKKKSGLSL